MKYADEQAPAKMFQYGPFEDEHALGVKMRDVVRKKERHVKKWPNMQDKPVMLSEDRRRQITERIIEALKIAPHSTSFLVRRVVKCNANTGRDALTALETAGRIRSVTGLPGMSSTEIRWEFVK